MSSARSPVDAAVGEGTATIRAMLRSAQRDLQKVAIVFVIMFLGSFYLLRLAVWDALKAVTRAEMQSQVAGAVQIIAQTPFDVILLQAKISLIAAAIVTLPVFIYVSRDALQARDLWPRAPVPTWQLLLVAVAVLTLFLGGLAYGYGVFFPFVFAFLAENALNAGFAPTYSIVRWTEFIVLLTISFGLASQLPLAMSVLTYADIVRYQTFREKWRHATVGVFIAGAMFTPPDPFTQVMWAVPVLALYGLSLYLSRVVTILRFGTSGDELLAVIRRHRREPAIAAVVGAITVAAVAGFLGLRPLLLAAVSTAALLTTGVLAIGVRLYRSLPGIDTVELGMGDPHELELESLDVAGIRAAPAEAFAATDEDAIVEMAAVAVDAGEHDRAEALLERYDAAAEGPSLTADVGDRTARASETFLTEVQDDPDAAEEFTGYYDDLRFVLDTLSSRSFRIIMVFITTLTVVFGWLYIGGIQRVYLDFLARMPSAVRPADVLSVVALHPMEALVFQVKFAAIIAALLTLPMLGYYSWPALREREIVRGRRGVIARWTAVLVVGLIGGSVFGYTVFAPTVISWLVSDAVSAQMLVTYRITNFFWLIVFTTMGIGLLADIPVLMLLLHRRGVSYEHMRSRWREVTVAILAVAAVFTPADVFTMFLVTAPLMAAYGLGLLLLFVLTLGGRREQRGRPSA
jgi:Twin arginine targeting (Tat) protein translocase TatC, Archaeal clade